MGYFFEPKKAYSYFSSNFVLKKTSAGWYAFKCPFCASIGDSMKHAVHFQYGMTKCWVCGYKEHIVDFIVDYEGVKPSEAKRILRESKPSNIDFDLIEAKHQIVSAVELPVGYRSILDGKGVMADRARNYLESRGFDLKELDRMGIGYCVHDEDDIPENEDYFGYIIIPFKQRGRLVYYIGRDYIGNFLRYKNPEKAKFGVGKGDLLFNEDALNIFDECFFTEGWADALTMGRQGISTQGWSFSQKQKMKILKSSCERLVFIPDAGKDNTGEYFYEKAVKLAMDFINHKEVVVLDLNSVADGKDVNEIGKRTVLDIKKETKILTVGSATEILLNYVPKVY